MTDVEEKAIAERESMLAPWRRGVFLEDALQRLDKFVALFGTLAAAQRGAAQSVADDAAQMRLAAERAPAAQRASDIARDAMLAFTDRVGTTAPRGEKADEIMRECVRLATYARKQAEAT